MFTLVSTSAKQNFPSKNSKFFPDLFENSLRDFRLSNCSRITMKRRKNLSNRFDHYEAETALKPRKYLPITITFKRCINFSCWIRIKMRWNCEFSSPSFRSNLRKFSNNFAFQIRIHWKETAHAWICFLVDPLTKRLLIVCPFYSEVLILFVIHFVCSSSK